MRVPIHMGGQMQDIVGQVLSVTTRQVGAQNRTIYDVAVGDGNTYTTFDGVIGSKAMGFQNRQASMRINVQQKGDFTNYYLNDIAELGQLPAPSAPVSPPPSPSPSTSTGGGMSPDREARIMRQSAYAAAATLIGNIYSAAGPEALPQAIADYRKLVTELATFAQSGNWTPTTAAEVAAQVNGQAGEQAVAVGAGEDKPRW